MIGAMADGATRISRVPGLGRHALDSRRGAAGAVVSEGDADGRGGLFVEVQGAGLRAPPRPRSTSATRAPDPHPPGWLAGQAEAGGRWTATSPSATARWTGSRRRWRRWAPGSSAAISAAAARVRGSGSWDRLPDAVASAQVKTCLLFAGHFGGQRHDGARVRPSRDHSERMLAAAGARLAGAAARSPSSPHSASKRGTSPCPATSPRPPSSSPR